MVHIKRDASGIDAIGRTAFAVAALRAAEHDSPQGLFRDPYAGHFLDAAGGVLGPDETGQAFVELMQTQTVVRTRFFDDHLLAASGTGCPGPRESRCSRSIRNRSCGPRTE